MASDYLGVVTNVGSAKLAASVGGSPLVVTDIALGDGNGAVITPIPTMTALVHEVWRGSVTAGAIDPENATIWRFQTVLPEEAGPFVVREIGLIDAAGDLIAMARTPTLEKKTPAGGVGVSIDIDIIVPISPTANVSVILGDDDKVDVSNMLRVPFIAVESILNAPPASPAEGVIHMCGTTPTGVWAGKANQLAQWQGSIWVFGNPPERTIVGVKGGDFYERTATGWRTAVQGSRYGAVAGTANAMTVALDPIPAAYGAGLSLIIKKGATANTGAVTLNVNGLGVKTVKRMTGDPLAANDLPANCLAFLVYDGVDFQLLSTIPSSAPPAASETVAGVTEMATAAETIAGTATDRSVHPAGLAALTSTTVRRGLIRSATGAEVIAGLLTDVAVTPEALAGLTGTTDRRGLLELATNAEALAGTDTSRAVTAAGVAAVIAALIDSAPGAMNTLNELAAALGDDPNFATTITNALALKATIASPNLTGNPTAPTPAPGDNDTSIATTAFVAAALAAAVVPATTTTAGIMRLTTIAEAIAGTVTDEAMTPETFLGAFIGSRQSLGAAGFQMLPGGLIEQWGTCTPTSAGTGTGGEVAVLFPMNFPTALRNVSLTTLQPSGAIGGNSSPYFRNPSAGGMTVGLDDNGSSATMFTVHYRVLGN